MFRTRNITRTHHTQERGKGIFLTHCCSTHFERTIHCVNLLNSFHILYTVLVHWEREREREKKKKKTNEPFSRLDPIYTAWTLYM